jgi:cell division protein FtsX
MDSAGSVAFYRSLSRGWVFMRGTKGWRAGTVSVAVSMLLLQLLLVALAGTRVAANDVLERGVVHLDVEEGTLDQRVQELYAGLRALPTVLDVEYVTGEQLLQEERARDESLDEFLDRYGMENPFPDAFVVTPQNSHLYDELRDFVQSEDERGGIAAAALGEISAREAAMGESLGTLGAATSAVGFLALLAMVVAFLASVDVVLRFGAARRATANAELLGGATLSLAAAPVVVASAIALLCALVLSVVFAIAVVSALAWSPSSMVGAWVARAVWTAIAPHAPAAVAIEAIVMIILSWIVGRASSALRVA